MALVHGSRHAPVHSLVAFLRRAYEDPRWLTTILLTNLGGIAFGYWYYREQLAATPPVLWPLVPDSPNALLLFSLALLAHRLGHPLRLLDWLGATAMLKVGLWTVLVLWVHRDYFLVPPLRDLNLLLAVLHGGMALQGLMLLHRMERLRPTEVVALGALLLLMDGADYLGGLHPRMPTRGLELVAAMTVALSVLCLLLLVLLHRRWPSVQDPLAVKK